MKEITLILGSFFGITGIILGAFGAHALKKVLSIEKLSSFEVGVRYQLYSAFTLLIIGFNLDFNSKAEEFASYGIILGTFLFSISIYLLSLSEFLNKNFKYLGPITPLGGLLMILGWVSLLISFIN